MFSQAERDGKPQAILSQGLGSAGELDSIAAPAPSLRREPLHAAQLRCPIFI